MKILYYNWVDYEDVERRGGGVSVYQANVLSFLSAEKEHELTFLCSGVSYDLFSAVPRWERIKHGVISDGVSKYEIINSGVMAPGHHSFGDKRQLDDENTKAVFFDFVEKNGPFDVIHFNNLEGLPASVLEIKKLFPKTKVVLSLHNYYPLCPQVNLWHKEEENCLDYENGWKCEDCLLFKHDPKIIKAANAVAYNLKKKKVVPGTFLFDKFFGIAFKFKPYIGRVLRYYKGVASKKQSMSSVEDKKIPIVELKPDHDFYRNRREEFSSYINENCDKVLVVSKRVGEVAVKFGLEPSLICESYIGTKHAELFDSTQHKKSILKDDGTLTLAYLGYMRRDKGFYFLVDALKNMPKNISEKISVVIAAKNIDSKVLLQLKEIGKNYNGIYYSDGYSHDQLDEILKDVDVGVVPVLWEDNLPQVAIEMHSRHIPVLASDLGGAQELSGRNEKFVFKNGDLDSFYSSLEDMISGNVSQEDYWSGALQPVSMNRHIQELIKIYS